MFSARLMILGVILLPTFALAQGWTSKFECNAIASKSKNILITEVYAEDGELVEAKISVDGSEAVPATQKTEPLAGDPGINVTTWTAEHFRVVGYFEISFPSRNFPAQFFDQDSAEEIRLSCIF